MTTALSFDAPEATEDLRHRIHSPIDTESVDTVHPIVLIVDDDPVARLTLSALLEQEGYHIEIACSAEEARECITSIRPDVILCDLVMKGTNGDQFCSWLKRHLTWRYVPVIAVTRVDNSIATAAMLDSGADDVIVKPVKGRELRARVGAALRTRNRYLALVEQSGRAGLGGRS